MAPVIGAIVAAVGAIATAVGAVFSAIGAFSIGNFAIGRILLQIGLNMALSALFAPKASRVADRQGSVLEMSLGEAPRQFVFGRACTGGSLANAWNDGGENEWETLVIIIADHEIDGFESFIIEDRTYPMTTQGAQNHADFKDDGTVRLWLEWRTGAPTDTTTPLITTKGVQAGEWTAEEAAASFKGLAYVTARYQTSEKVWANGRPSFRFVVRGAKVYDPRLDSTYAGGSGPQRWGQPSTYVWSRNARVNHYNFARGVWNYTNVSGPQLMVGPGKSAEECHTATLLADMNVCDEAVALKAGGTEPRYCADGVIGADERWIDVEEHFAAAMGGELVEREGGIGILVGAARTVEFEFTDGELLSGKDLSYQAETPAAERINTVVARYVEPSQLYEEASAPMRRSQEDIDTDGQPREETIDLVFVTSNTQAQRCAEIKRRKARLMPAAVVPLGPAYMLVEDGDWGEWTSARRFGGDTRTFEARGVVCDEEGNQTIALKEIAASVFAWNPAVDELDQAAPAYRPPGAIAEAFVANFEAEPIEITSSAGIASGAIRATWTPPNDVTIVGIKLEFRPKGSANSSTVTAPPQAGEYVIAVLPVTDVDYEIRATPQTSPKRDSLTTAWRDVLLSVPFTPPQPPANFVGRQNGDLIQFVWTAFADTTLRYEIRCGPDFELGRIVASDIGGGAASVIWPIASEDDDLLFWIKTVHRSGLYSEQAALWIASPNDLAGRNFVLAEDFQADGFPGVRHSLFDAYVGDQNVLELARTDAGISVPRGDYYASIELIASFAARTWLEHRASAYINDTGDWEDDEEAWEDDAEDWLPDIGDAGGDASLDAFIAVNADLPDHLIEGFRFNDTLQGKRGLDPDTSSGITYAPAKTANGVVVSGALEYALDLPATFSTLFDRRLGEKPSTDETIIELTDDDGQFLRFIWRAEDETFVLEGNYGAEIAFDLPWEEDDTISVSIWQRSDARGAVIASKQHNTPQANSALLI